MVIAKNPAQYGFQFEPQGTLAYERVPLENPIDLRRVAEWTGASIDDIESLNPELRRWTTPVRHPDYAIKVPVGTGDAFRVRLAESSPEDLNAFQWHTVKRGESLLTIARKLKVKQSDLAEANSLSTRSRVAVGQRLIIPREPTTLLAARAEQPAPVPETVVADSKPVTSRAAPQPAPRVERGAEPQKVVYRVKRGDTLFSIARLYNTTVDSLKEWNTRIRGSRINVGDRLTIFAARAN
jgi:membrane-bound lytic murein transglycosylase D